MKWLRRLTQSWQKNHSPRPPSQTRTSGHRVSQWGQTLVEVLIATAIVGMVVTAVAAGLTFSIKNSAQSQYRTVATAEAQDVVEFLRRARVQLGWEAFVNELPGGIYCVNDLPSTTPGLSELVVGACTEGQVLAGTEFRRQLDILTSTDTEITYQITVEWLDADLTRSVTITGEFKPWLN